MYLDEGDCSSIWIWVRHDLIDSDFLWNTYSFVWIIGTLGNLANIVVFNHERMAKSYIISLLYWLAICDFLELVSLLMLVYYHEDFRRIYLFYSLSSFINSTNTSKPLSGPECYQILLLLTLHNISILLNITLAFVQLLMIVRPFQYKRLFSGNQSTKWIVISILFISIIVTSLFSTSLLYSGSNQGEVSLTFEKNGNASVYYNLDKGRSHNIEVINSIYKDAMSRRDGILEEVISINLTKGEDFRRSFIKKFGTSHIRKCNATTLAKWYTENFDTNDTVLRYFNFGSLSNSISITIFGYILVRTGLLMVLIMTSIGLIFGSIRARRIQNDLRGSVSQITGRVTSRMTNMTLLVVLMFSITEIPIVAHSFFMLPVKTLMVTTHFLDYYHQVNIFGNCSSFPHVCCDSLHYFVTILMVSSLLFSSSYTTVCFLIMSTQYREILRFVLCNIFKSLKNFPSYIQRTIADMIFSYRRISTLHNTL